MAAATSTVYTNIPRPGTGLQVPVAASTHVYRGSLVCANTSGLAVPAVDTASFVFLGIAENDADNSTGGGAAINVQVEPPYINKAYQINAVSPDATWVGKLVSVLDDQTVQLNSASSHNVIVGTCNAVLNTTSTGSIVVNLLARN